MNKRPFDGVLFDLDGTLVDTAPDICAAANAALTDLRLPPVPLAEARTYIGDGMERFVKRILTRQWWGEPAPELLRQAMAQMYRHYERECMRGLRVYPGVKETLTTLAEQGLALACVTNKPARFTTPLLAACGLDNFFTATISGDTLPVRKPDPAPLHAAAEQLRAPISRLCLVGDSMADSRAAAAAECPFIVVTYGYHRDNMIPPAALAIDDFPALLEFVFNGIGGGKD